MFTSPAAITTITPEQLAAFPRRPRVIDVREPHHEALAVVCRSGGRSSRAAAVLTRLGFMDLFNLAGGTQAHADAGLPVERG